MMSLRSLLFATALLAAAIVPALGQDQQARQDILAAPVLRADTAHVVIDQILKRRPLLLVAGGAHVGDVVGDHLNVEFLCRHAGRCCIEGAHRSKPSGYAGTSASFSTAVLCKSCCCCSSAEICV